MYLIGFLREGVLFFCLAKRIRSLIASNLCRFKTKPPLANQATSRCKVTSFEMQFAPKHNENLLKCQRRAQHSQLGVFSFPLLFFLFIFPTLQNISYTGTARFLCVYVGCEFRVRQIMVQRQIRLLQVPIHTPKTCLIKNTLTLFKTKISLSKEFKCAFTLQQ